MSQGVAIDPNGITTVRTSIERVLLPRGLVVQKPFRSAADFPAYWKAALELHGAEDLAMWVASELPVGSFGRTSYAFASASTIGDAYNVFRRDSQRAVSGLTTELEIVGMNAELRMHGPELLWPIFEILLGLLALRARQLSQPPARIVAAMMPGRAPADVSPWIRVFMVKPRFDAGYGAIVLPATDLDRPLRTADAAIREALGGGPVRTTADEVRSHVRAWIRDAPEIGEVSRALGMSLRTLQRRLREEKVTFRQLVLDVKVDVAKRLLDHEHMSIADIASAVGFAQLPAFSRAFAQNVGMSPTEFRARRK